MSPRNLQLSNGQKSVSTHLSLFIILVIFVELHRGTKNERTDIYVDAWIDTLAEPTVLLINKLN